MSAQWYIILIQSIERDTMLGYTDNDLTNMMYGVDTAMLLIDSNENPAIYNYLVTTSDFLKGLWAEGYFD